MTAFRVWLPTSTRPERANVCATTPTMAAERWVDRECDDVAHGDETVVRVEDGLGNWGTYRVVAEFTLCFRAHEEKPEPDALAVALAGLHLDELCEDAT